MGVDQMILNNVYMDERCLGFTYYTPKYLVFTGAWAIIEDEEGSYLTATDDYTGKTPTTLLLAEGCEIIDGEKLCVYTDCILDGVVYSVVLFKECAVELSDEENG